MVKAPFTPGDPSRDRRYGANTESGSRAMSEQDQAELRLSFARLRQDHEDFDAAIRAMEATGCNALQIQRMKKKKLAIKDKLQRIEDQIIPDIIA